MNTSIGLFGGTFDPVHNGHLKIAEAFIDSDLIDELWVLLTPDPPHKTEQVHAPFFLREQMLEAAFSEADNIKISTVENTLPRPTYTIQTLEFLTKNYPSYNFYLCIGEDSLTEFADWYRYEDILDTCELIVARRPGFDGESVDDHILENVQFIDHDPVEVSSSNIRKLISDGKSADKYLPKEVMGIIKENSCYKN